ncbi:hypothetical protein AAHE18_10G149800 [Arachis hypogaea]
MFTFTSLGGKVIDLVNDGTGPPQFIISGQNYHRIGSLLPQAGQVSKFFQLYIYDTEHELTIEKEYLGNYRQSSYIDRQLIIDLTQMIDQHNPIAQSFRRATKFNENHLSEVFSLKLFSQRERDRRVYNYPSCDKVAALIVGDFDSSHTGRDVIVKSAAGQLQRIYKTHALYWPLQYPLLFPYGEDGYQLGILYRDIQDINVAERRTRVSMRNLSVFVCK